MKQLSLMLFFLLATTFSIAQVNINPKIGFGVYAFNIKDGKVPDEKLMLTLGSDIRIKKGAWFFNTGAHFAMDAIDKTENTFDKGSIKFVRVPANIGLFLTGKDRSILAIYLKGGIANNFFLSSSIDNGITEDQISKYNMATNFGIGIDLFKILNVSLDYDYGLTNYFDQVPLLGKKQAFLFSFGLVF